LARLSENEKSHAGFLNFQKRIHKEFCSIVNSNVELRKTSISVVVLPLKFSHCPTFLGIEGQTHHELHSVKINSAITLKITIRVFEKNTFSQSSRFFKIKCITMQWEIHYGKFP
jgi:hypothetical protein